MKYHVKRKNCAHQHIRTIKINIYLQSKILRMRVECNIKSYVRIYAYTQAHVIIVGYDFISEVFFLRGCHQRREI